MDFSGTARATQKPTIEHLHPKALGGGNELDNLVLCHPGCNKQLADRPRAEKERLRARRLRKLAAKSAPPTLVSSAPALRPTQPRASAPARRGPDWQRVALIATATATFFAGLSLGMGVG